GPSRGDDPGQGIDAVVRRQADGRRDHGYRRVSGVAEGSVEMNLRVILLIVCLCGGTVSAQVTYERLLHADREPQNWLTYGGGYASQRYTLLNQITRDNVRTLTLKWIWRPKYLDKMETTPLVVDGVLYAVQNSEVVAFDAATGRAFWTYRYRVPPE